MNLHYQEYYKRLLGCFMGKSIGGTLGMPYEGEERLLNLTYYDPIPTEMVANDDLDLQVVWLESIRRHGLPVNRRYLAKAWTENIRGAFDEYGVAQRNIRKWLFPPLSGAYDNKFYAGMGAAIRTELWACLCPGDPDLAVELAREDACMDHQREGVEAACFLAAVESAAFVEQDRETLLNIGFAHISPDGRLASALHDTIQWWEEFHDLPLVRKQILKKYYVQNWTDVSINLAFILLGWFAGAGDFGASLCAVVNCGNDTDCTGATLGALLGILNPENIGEEWSRPIGNRLVLSSGMVGMHERGTIDEMCNQIAALSIEVQNYYHSAVRTVDYPVFPDYAAVIAPPWKATPDGTLLEQKYCVLDSVVALTPVYTQLRYPEGVALPLGQSRTYTLSFLALTEKKENYTLRLRVPDGWQVSPQEQEITLSGTRPTDVSFTIAAPDAEKNAYIHFLDICLQNSTTRIDMTAGIATAISWLRKPLEKALQTVPTIDLLEDAQRVDVAGHYQTVPAGRQLLALEFKSGMRMKNVLLIAEGTRGLRVWIDGKLVSQSDGSHYVPAYHRGPVRPKINLLTKWHQMMVEVEDGPEGEIFIGMAKPFGLEWIEELEWRLPKKEALV